MQKTGREEGWGAIFSSSNFRSSGLSLVESVKSSFAAVYKRGYRRGKLFDGHCCARVSSGWKRKGAEPTPVIDSGSVTRILILEYFGGLFEIRFMQVGMFIRFFLFSEKSCTLFFF